MTPAADHGLFGPDSISWRIDREVLVLAGGSCALLMQLAHPAVAAGVADHSDYRADPFARLRRRGYGMRWSPGRARGVELLAAASRRLLPLVPDPLRHVPAARSAERRLARAGARG